MPAYSAKKDLDKILKDLLNQEDLAKGNRVRRVRNSSPLMKNYLNIATIEYPSEFHEIAINLQGKGLIQINWIDRFQSSIDSIDLTSYKDVSLYLGVTPFEAELESSLSWVESEVLKLGLQAVFNPIKNELKNAWQLKKLYCGKSYQQQKELLELLSVASKVLSNIESVDYRHFSVSTLGDSKKLDAIKNSLSSMLKFIKEDIPGEYEPNEVLGMFGIHPILHPISISGPLTVTDAQGFQVDCRIQGGVSLWGPKGLGLSLKKESVHLLTIENLATYQRYIATEQSPNELIIYTAGFPSPQLKVLYKKIVNLAPISSVRHWGDIDLGGLRILRVFEKWSMKRAVGFRMSFEDYSDFTASKPLSEREIKEVELIQLSRQNRYLLKRLLENRAKYEQESFYL